MGFGGPDTTAAPDELFLRPCLKPPHSGGSRSATPDVLLDVRQTLCASQNVNREDRAYSERYVGERRVSTG